MPNFKEKKEEILPTEEEINRLRQELAAKERELARLQERKREKIETIFSYQREKKGEKEVKRKIEKEKKETFVTKEKPSKVLPYSSREIFPSKIKRKDLLRDLQYIMNLPKPRQVKTLIYLAFKKGLHYATLIAEKMKNPYFLDEFHDTLVDELYEVLKKRKMI